MRLFTTKLVILVYLFTLSNNLFSQNRVFDKAEQKLVNGLERSIQLLRDQSNTLRTQMIQISDREGLMEEYVFGKDRKLINEGMSTLFAKRPQKLDTRLNRENSMALFEQLHIDLYNADVKLMYAKQLLTLIKKQKKKGKQSDLFIEFMEKHKQFHSPRKKNQLLADIIIKASPTYQYGKLDDVFEQRPARTKSIPVASSCKSSMGYIATIIEASYPLNGQANFHIDEGQNKQWGYIHFSDILDNNFADNDIFIKWTNTKGNSVFSPAVYYFRLEEKASVELFYYIPVNFLKNEQVYKAQIVLKEAKTYWKAPDINSQVRSIFRIRSKDPQKTYDDGVVFGSPIFFRVSKYKSSFEKLTKSALSIDSVGDINIRLPEPLDSIELFGTECLKPSYNFHLTNNLDKAINKVQTSRIAYYLKYPIIEPIDTNNINLPYTAFTDNSYEDLSIIYAEGNLSFNTTGLSFNSPNFSISQNSTPQSISQNDFIHNKSYQSKEATLKISYPELYKTQQKYDNIVKKVIERSHHRSKYFYALYIIDSKRKKIKPKHGISFFEEREREILEQILPSSIRNVSLTDVLKQFAHIRVTVHKPGSDLNVTIKDLKPKDYKKPQLKHFQQLD